MIKGKDNTATREGFLSAEEAGNEYLIMELPSVKGKWTIEALTDLIQKKALNCVFLLETKGSIEKYR